MFGAQETGWLGGLKAIYDHITSRLFLFPLFLFFWIMVFSLDLLCPISGRTVPLQFHNLYTYHCFFFFRSPFNFVLNIIF